MSLSIPPEKNKKNPEVFSCFQGLQKETSGMKLGNIFDKQVLYFSFKVAVQRFTLYLMNLQCSGNWLS